MVVMAMVKGLLMLAMVMVMLPVMTTEYKGSMATMDMVGTDIIWQEKLYN